MNFTRNKAELLAAHLREALEQGKLQEPLPGTETWSRRLGVARMTLTRALRILSIEGLVSIHPRGTRIIQARRTPRPAREPIVRLLFETREYHGVSSLTWVTALAERFREGGIRFRIEPANEARMRLIAAQPPRPHEIFLLLSLNPCLQQCFDQARHAAIIIGEPAPGVQLPSDGVDIESSVVHAVHYLHRQKIDALHLLIGPLSAPGLAKANAAFSAACHQWRGKAVSFQTVVMPLKSPEAASAANRYARSLLPGSRTGLILLGPVQPPLIMMTLLYHGIRIPQEAIPLAILPPHPDAMLQPEIPVYRMNDQRYARRMLGMITHYFKTGDLIPPAQPFLLNQTLP